MSRARWKRWMQRLVGAAATVVCAPVLYALVAVLAGCHTNATAPRHADTGIRVGAEERDLGPEDAEKAVLFVHGFVGGSSNFADLPDQVAAKGWRVRCMRLPGHGTSPRDMLKTTADDLLDAVRAEAKALREDHETLVLVGHSMGGALSTVVASEMPVEGLVLGAPYFGVTHHWYYGLKPEQWTNISSPFVHWLYKGKLFTQLNRKEAKKDCMSYTWVPTKGVLTLIEVGRRASAPDVLAGVTCPVLLMNGAGDVAASHEKAREAVAAMATTGKRTVDLPRSNHMIYFDYDRERVFEETLAFLDGLAQ